MSNVTQYRRKDYAPPLCEVKLIVSGPWGNTMMAGLGFYGGNWNIWEHQGKAND